MSELTATRQVVMKTNYKLGNLQKKFSGLQESMNRIEVLVQRLVSSNLWQTGELRNLQDLGQPGDLDREMARRVDDLKQIVATGWEQDQLPNVSTPEGNLNFPSTDPSVVVTGWGEDPKPHAVIASPTLNNPNPSHGPEMVKDMEKGVSAVAKKHTQNAIVGQNMNITTAARGVGEEVVPEQGERFNHPITISYPFTHNLPKEIMPADLDGSIDDKYTFIKESGDRRVAKRCFGILKTMKSHPEYNYVAYRKGIGVVCNKKGGFGVDDFVIEFFGEVESNFKDEIARSNNNKHENGVGVLNITSKKLKPEVPSKKSLQGVISGTNNSDSQKCNSGQIHSANGVVSQDINRTDEHIGDCKVESSAFPLNTEDTISETRYPADNWNSCQFAMSNGFPVLNNQSVPLSGHEYLEDVVDTGARELELKEFLLSVMKEVKDKLIRPNQTQHVDLRVERNMPTPHLIHGNGRIDMNKAFPHLMQGNTRVDMNTVSTAQTGIHTFDLVNVYLMEIQVPVNALGSISDVLKPRRGNLFEEMQRSGTLLDNIIALRKCVMQTWLPASNALFEMLLNGMTKDGVMLDCTTYTILVHGYSSSGQLAEVVTTYGILLHGYVIEGALVVMHALLDLMAQNGISLNHHIFYILICAYGKHETVDDAMFQFNLMIDEGLTPDIIVFSTLVNGLCTCDQWEEAEELAFEMMNRGIHSNAVFFKTMMGNLPGLNRRKSISYVSSCLSMTALTSIPSEEEQKYLLEEIDRLLPLQRGVTSCKLLFGLLRTAIILKASPSCVSNLERRISLQLDKATLEDLLIPNISESVETLYDVDCAHRILDHFLAMDQETGGASPGLGEDEQLLASPSLMPITMVAKLLDGYLAEVAPDVISYGIMMYGYCLCDGRTEGASALFKEMLGKGIHHGAITYGIMLEGLFKTGRSVAAKKLFKSLKVVYTLQLPEGVGIYPVFHVSQLKIHCGSKAISSPDLSLVSTDNELMAEPDSVLENSVVTQWLIPWENLPPDDTSWEDTPDDYLLYILGDLINYLSILEAVFMPVLKIIFSFGLDNANKPLWSFASICFKI